MRSSRSLYGLVSATLSAACLSVLVAFASPSSAAGGSAPLTRAMDLRAPVAAPFDVAATPRAVLVVQRQEAVKIRAVLAYRPMPVGRLRDFGPDSLIWRGSPYLLPARFDRSPPAD